MSEKLYNPDVFKVSLDGLRTWWHFSWLGEKFEYLTCLFWHRHNVIKLRDDPRYLNYSYKVELALEKIFLEFYEEDKATDYTDWECSFEFREARKIIDDCYKFFTVERKERQDRINELCDILYKPPQGGDMIDWLNRQYTPEETFLRNKEYKLSQELDKREDEIFCNLVKIRGYLWV